ncbi:MAG: hypothetical protein ABI616_06525 [Pseudomonadota bacterium]
MNYLTGVLLAILVYGAALSLRLNRDRQSQPGNHSCREHCRKASPVGSTAWIAA